ncbi:hypothetical protein H8E07_13495 [bacterium]|nr:hypothetical protein [bacterium]
MASVLSSALTIDHQLALDPNSVTGRTGPIGGENKQVDRWANGITSGSADRGYKRVRVGLGAAATDSYNTLAAGGLLDLDNQAIDLDEIKGFSLRCTDGAIKLVASAGTPLGLFLAAGDGIAMTAGDAFAFSWGAGGLDVTVNSLFEITETSGATTADYTLQFHGAQ